MISLGTGLPVFKPVNPETFGKLDLLGLRVELVFETTSYTSDWAVKMSMGKDVYRDNYIRVETNTDITLK